jgi:hypothetical protein
MAVVFLLRTLLDLVLAALILAFVVFNVELNSTQLDYVSSFQLVIKVILSRFGVSDNNKHLVIDVFIWYRVAFFIPRRLSHYGVILHLELTIPLLDYDHRFGLPIDFFGLCPD